MVSGVEAPHALPPFFSAQKRLQDAKGSTGVASLWEAELPRLLEELHYTILYSTLLNSTLLYSTLLYYTIL